MKNKLTIKIGLALILAVAMLSSGLYLGSTFAASSNVYDKEELTITEVEKLYHSRINDLFNAKLKLLKQGEKGPGTNEIPKGDECSENNYSTFCLALSVADEYDKFEEVLRKRKTYVEITDEQGLEYYAMTAVSQGTEIDNELIRSKKALDLALATYNELQSAYRMHLKYEALIKALTKYNQKLIDYRKEVEKLPGKFIDATTASCT